MVNASPSPPIEPQALRDLTETVLARPEYNGPAWSPAHILARIGPDLEALTTALRAAADALDRAAKIEGAARDVAEAKESRAEVTHRLALWSGDDDTFIALCKEQDAATDRYLSAHAALRSVLAATARPSAGTEP